MGGLLGKWAAWKGYEMVKDGKEMDGMWVEWKVVGLGLW